MRTVAGNWIKVEQQTSPLKSDNAGNVLVDQSFYTSVGKADYNQTRPIELFIYLRDAAGLYKRAFFKTYAGASKETGLRNENRRCYNCWQRAKPAAK